MVTVAIVGLGARGGYTYSEFQNIRPELMKITALADLRESLVEKYKNEFNVPEENCFSSAEALLSRDKLADVLIVATQDRDHYLHAVKGLKKGYHILLEKPISPDLWECLEIERIAKEEKRLVTVCHVLRYTQFFRSIKQIIESGKLGMIRGIEQTENVAYWHYAHSFVRGNWNNAKKSSPMILQKCCHDLDILQWLIGSEPVSVSSQGSLNYFTYHNAPSGSTERCVENCSVKDRCPYNAERFYLESYLNSDEDKRKNNWIYNVLCENDTSVAKMERAVKYGKYGKCVFRCDNDVVDHQVCDIIFANGAQATLTMTAFTKDCKRVLRIYGTKGELVGDDLSNIITVKPYEGNEEVVDVGKIASDLSGHGGGDNKMMEEFLSRVDAKDLSGTDSSIERSVLSHVLAFAAEASRLADGKTIKIAEFKKEAGKAES